MQKGRVLTGARARFSLKGVKVGYARNVSMGEEITYDPIEVLDNIEVEEFVPTAYRVTLSAGMFRIVGETLKSKGLFPSTGGDSATHLSNILISGDMTAIIEDTGVSPPKIIASLEQVKISSRNWSIDARGAVGEDVQFVAVRAKDESEVA